MADVQRCETCVYWRRSSGRHRGPPNPGNCHRFPPVVVGKQYRYQGRPETSATDWCGEWRPAEDQANRQGS